MRFFVWVLIIIFSQNFCILNAKEGKVYLKNGRTLVGDISPGENGQTVVCLKSGAIQFGKNEISKIEYFKRKKGTVEKKHPFFYALYNFPSNVITNYESATIYDEIIKRSASKYNLHPALVKAVIKVESSFNPFDVSCKGAKGLMQLMPYTASCLGVDNIFNPMENIDGGCKYLRTMLNMFNGDLKLSLAAYNAGPNAVKKYNGIPPYTETQNYVKAVIKYYTKYSKDDTEFKTFVDERGVINMSNTGMTKIDEFLKK